MKGNDRIGLMKPFLAFFTKALQSITDGPTDRPTDTRSYRDARTHLKMAKKSVNQDIFDNSSQDLIHNERGQALEAFATHSVSLIFPRSENP